MGTAIIGKLTWEKCATCARFHVICEEFLTAYWLDNLESDENDNLLCGLYWEWGEE